MKLLILALLLPAVISGETTESWEKDDSFTLKSVATSSAPRPGPPKETSSDSYEASSDEENSATEDPFLQYLLRKLLKNSFDNHFSPSNDDERVDIAKTPLQYLTPPPTLAFPPTINDEKVEASSTVSTNSPNSEDVNATTTDSSDSVEESNETTTQHENVSDSGENETTNELRRESRILDTDDVDVAPLRKVEKEEKASDEEKDEDIPSTTTLYQEEHLSSQESKNQIVQDQSIRNNFKKGEDENENDVDQNPETSTEQSHMDKVILDDNDHDHQSNSVEEDEEQAISTTTPSSEWNSGESGNTESNQGPVSSIYYYPRPISQLYRPYMARPVVPTYNNYPNQYQNIMPQRMYRFPSFISQDYEYQNQIPSIPSSYPLNHYNFYNPSTLQGLNQNGYNMYLTQRYVQPVRNPLLSAPMMMTTYPQNNAMSQYRSMYPLPAYRQYQAPMNSYASYNNYPYSYGMNTEETMNSNMMVPRVAYDGEFANRLYYPLYY